MIFKKLALRVISSLLVFSVLLLLESCEHEPPVKPTPTPTPQPVPPPITQPKPPVPLPGVACGSNFITGYTNLQSYFQGDSITAFLNAEAKFDCHLDVHDINGLLVLSIPATLFVQYSANADPSSDGFGYRPTIKFKIPDDLPSGVYQIENKIPFIVKTKSPVDLIVVYSSNTENAYSTSGGRGLYSTDRTERVSFLRPLSIERFCTECLTWFSKQTTYRIGYVADIDLDDYSTIQNSKLLVIAGHSEYWTRKARINFDTYVNSGKDAIILSGNTMWWQVRYSEDKTKMICYKQAPDPISDPLLKTINWDNSSLQYSILSSIGADFPHGGYGLKTDNGWNGYKIILPKSPLLEGLNMAKGDIISVPTTEFDGAPISSFNDEGFPIIDKNSLNVNKIELIGFDRGSRGAETFGTFFVMRKSPSSGVIVNTCSTDWCSSAGMGGTSGDKIKTITKNAIDKLLNNQSVFTQ